MNDNQFHFPISNFLHDICTKQNIFKDIFSTNEWPFSLYYITVYELARGL